MSIKNKILATSTTSALVVSAIVPVALAAEFHDADQVQDWAKEAVEALVKGQVLQGDDNGNFNPTGIVTRATAAEILSKAKKLPTEGTENFPDVTEKDWFYNAVVATAQAGVFKGNDKGQFNPNDELTREQAAAVIVRTFGLTGEADLSDFADANKVSNWAKDDVEIAVANGVIKGDGTSLNPDKGVTRSEMAVMVHRVLLKQTETESAPIVESVTLNSADQIVIEFKEAIGSEVDVNKITVAGYEADENGFFTAKELTGSDFTASVTDNKLSLTAKDGVKFATGAEGNGEQGNLISLGEQAVVSKDSATSIEATNVTEGTVVDGKLADVTFVDNAAPVLLFAKEVTTKDITFTFSEGINVEGEVAPLFSTNDTVVGELAVESENKLTVTFADAWKDSDTVLLDVTVDYVVDEVSYIADTFGNKVETTQVTGVQEIEKSELENAVAAAGTAVTSLTTKLDELNEKIEAKTLTSKEASELFTLTKSAQEKVDAVATLDENNAELTGWNDAINSVPFVAVGTFVNENEATIAFSKPIDESIVATDIKNALKPVKVGEEEKNTSDYYFGDLDRLNGTVKLKKTSSADDTRWGAGLEEGKVVITIDQNSTFGQLLSQQILSF